MRYGRLENDTRWNYGLEVGRSHYQLDAFRFSLWLFRNKLPSDPYGAVRIERGFMIDVEFGLSDRIFSFRLPRIRGRIL